MIGRVPGLMISNGPGAQYRRGLSVGPIHECADVSSWMRSRNHMLDLSLTGFDPERPYPQRLNRMSTSQSTYRHSAVALRRMTNSSKRLESSGAYSNQVKKSKGSATSSLQW